ncbi:short chain dehydrogenase [Xylaria bambusicola]|uniref:short chain dehydrogenase n=1 Tax=Xylaria bambusicola TaxID=326684 RepID=UPI0020075BBD|nr:short chain dehydrogenase [Xylaria bambusicola]KAI0521942.1 short chain dehydrogenase [Xylaria bambusicola]
MGWEYKTVLMVGCTAGLGVAMAERMIEAGSFVIAVGRRKERLDAFLEKHGGDKVAVEQFDITDIEAVKGWAEGIVKAHPRLDCVVLNAGIQRPCNFARPEAIDVDLVRKEIDTNYTSYIALTAAFLPHLQALSRKGRGAALVAVSSGLALVPLPRCANYCATKAALHALVWSIRAQLRADEKSQGVKVIEVVPPAVQTELHELQEDMRAAGLANIGITIEEFMKDCWPGLENGDEEILIGPIRENFGTLEDGRRKAFARFVSTVPK